MRIGIDIDGVLNSQYNFCIDYGTKFCNELGNYKLENVNVIDTTDMFLWEENIAHQFWNKYREDLVIKLPAKKYASEVIHRLKEEDNSIYIITARKNNDEWFPDHLKKEVEFITKKWLDNNKIYYDEIVFNVKDKGKYCRENNINIMIEDDPRNLKKLIGNTNIIIFDYPYNRIAEFSKLTRAYSWYDIYNKIKTMEENKHDISNHRKN